MKNLATRMSPRSWTRRITHAATATILLACGGTTDPGPGGLIQLSTGSVALSAVAGGSEPGPATVGVTNGAAGELPLQLSATRYGPGASDWLSATLDATSAPATMTLRAIVAGLGPGSYTAAVPVASPAASNSPQEIQVQLTVTAVSGPIIGLSRNELSLTLASGTVSSTQQVEVENDGAGALAGLSLGAPVYTGGPSGWLSASLSGTVAPATVSIQASALGLAPGIYAALVPVLAPGAANSPQSFAVTLTVTSGAVAPAIGLSRTNVGFAATVGGGQTAPTSVAVTNVGGGSLTALQSSIAYQSGSGWLTATLAGTSAPTTLSLRASPAGLSPGTYVATALVSSAVASNSPQRVSVTFTVAAAGSPAIALSATSIGFSAITGGASPPQQSVSVTNGGAGSLTGLALGAVSYGGGATGWLSATLSSAVAPATIALGATTGSLAPGTYTATVPVTSPVASNSPQTISVTLTVSAASPTIALSPPTLAFTAPSGGGSPPSQTVGVTNGGGGSLTGLALGTITYGAGQPTGWLGATLSGATAPASVTVTATTGALAPGSYTASVPVTSPVAGNSPQTIGVTFTVPGPAIVLAPDAVTVAGTSGQTPAMVPVNVTNGGGGTLTGLGVGAVHYQSGESGWLTATLGGTTAPTILTLRPDAVSLSPGTHVAQVPVTSGVASNSPRNVTVTFNVASAPVPTIALSRSSVAMVATVGAGSPPDQTVSVTNGGTGTLDDLALDATTYGPGATGWLTATLSGPSAPATVTLRAASTGLAAGSYTATVPVTSATAGNSPENIAVTLTVDPPLTGLTRTLPAYMGGAASLVVHGNGRLYATTNGSYLVEMDTSDLAILREVFLNDGQAHQMTSDGTHLYVHLAGGSQEVVKIDPSRTWTSANDLIVARSPALNGAGSPEGFIFLGGSLYVAVGGPPGKVVRLNPSTMAFLGEWALPLGAENHGFTTDGTDLFVLSVPARYVDNDRYYKVTPALVQVGELVFPWLGALGGNVYLPANGKVYSGGGRLARIDPATLQVEASQPPGVHWLATDGKWIYRIQYGDDSGATPLPGWIEAVDPITLQAVLIRDTGVPKLHYGLVQAGYLWVAHEPDPGVVARYTLHP